MIRVWVKMGVVLLAVVLAACGDSKQAPTTPAATSATAADLTPLLVAKGVLPGFESSGAEPVQQADAEEWAATNQEPDPAELKALGFVAGARQDLIGPPGAYGLNLVERFDSADGAQQRLASTVQSLADEKGRFDVSGVPGAVGFDSGNDSRSVAFSKGDTVFLLSYQVSKQTPSVKAFKTAVREWYATLPD